MIDTTDEKLIRLFSRHYTDAVDAVMKFRARLAKLELPFDFDKQLREQFFPGLAPDQFAPLCYYFVPCTLFSGDPQMGKPVQFCADGIGLNMGCPVRLSRALGFLEKLPEKEHGDAKAKLANSQEHLSIVEELLWVRGWRGQDDCRHAGRLREGGKNVDWTFTAMGTRIFLECKFRPSDWRLLSEQETYKGGRGYLAKAAEQLSERARDSGLQLVGITGVDSITREIAHKLGAELTAYPHIDGVVYRSLAGMIHVLSQKPAILQTIMGLLDRLDVDDFPTSYVVFYHGQARDARVALAKGSSDEELGHSGVLVNALKPRSRKPVPIVAEGTFRATISWAKSSDEPRIDIVARWM